MNQLEQDQLKMYCNNIHKYETFEELKQHILKTKNGHQTFDAIKIDLENYYNKYGRKKKYWMLICNPKLWGDDTEEFEVNELLYNLNKHNIESWKINARNSMDIAMKAGDLGIIKVSEDNRNKALRMDDDGHIVEKLEAGIYAVFEIVKDEDGEVTWESTNGNFYVNIKTINK